MRSVESGHEVLAVIGFFCGDPRVFIACVSKPVDQIEDLSFSRSRVQDLLDLILFFIVDDDRGIPFQDRWCCRRDVLG
jgi:hypothetical protein